MASTVSRKFFSRTTGQGLPLMECAAYGSAIAGVRGLWHSPRSARRQSGVRAAAIHKRTNRSQVYETRHWCIKELFTDFRRNIAQIYMMIREGYESLPSHSQD
jgi:hypothetical protein